MVWRIWAFLMVVFVGGVWLLVIPFSPAPILETGTVLPLYRAMGIMPEIGKTTISTAIAHDVFEVPGAGGGCGWLRIAKPRDSRLLRGS